MRPIDEDDCNLRCFRELNGFARKHRRRDHHALSCVISVKSSRKLLNGRPTDRRLPTLRLYVDTLEAEAVFLDDAADSTISRFPDDLGGISIGSAVTTTIVRARLARNS
jgi:hypothetical protein